MSGKVSELLLSLHRPTYVLTADGLDNIIGGCTEKFGNDGELVHVVLSREERLALEHLGENASCTPDINLNIVLLPCEHDLRGSVVSGRYVTRHLGILYTGETEVANLEIAVLVDEDVGRFLCGRDRMSDVAPNETSEEAYEVTVDDSGRVHILESTLQEDGD